MWEGLKAFTADKLTDLKWKRRLNENNQINEWDLKFIWTLF